MARTLSGKLTGRAAATEIAELREELRQQVQERRMTKLHEKACSLYTRLVELDPEGGEAWYDDDDNVPAFGPVRERIVILERRIAQLETGR